MGVPFGNGGEKKFNWASELSTFFRNEPFGENVEGLSRWEPFLPLLCSRLLSMPFRLANSVSVYRVQQFWL
jgi:hypothetical protein